MVRNPLSVTRNPRRENELQESGEAQERRGQGNAY